MRRLWILLFACAGGCGTVFRLDEVSLPDVLDCDEPIGHDEDQDGVDDACDPCPFSSDNDTDVDADDIADACDPDTAVQNTRLLFDGFGSVSTNYTIVGGGIANDAFAFNGVIGSATNGALLWPGGQGIDPVWITAGVDVTNVDYPDTYREVGLVFEGAATNGINGTHCILAISPAPDMTQYVQLFARNRPAGDKTIDTRVATLKLADLRDGLVRGSSTRAAPAVTTCSFEAAGAQSAIVGVPDPLPPAGLPGVYFANIDATIAFLFITGRR